MAVNVNLCVVMIICATTTLTKIPFQSVIIATVHFQMEVLD